MRRAPLPRAGAAAAAADDDLWARYLVARVLSMSPGRTGLVYVTWSHGADGEDLLHNPRALDLGLDFVAELSPNAELEGHELSPRGPALGKQPEAVEQEVTVRLAEEE